MVKPYMFIPSLGGGTLDSFVLAGTASLGDGIVADGAGPDGCGPSGALAAGGDAPTVSPGGGTLTLYERRGSFDAPTEYGSVSFGGGGGCCSTIESRSGCESARILSRTELGMLSKLRLPASALAIAAGSRARTLSPSEGSVGELASIVTTTAAMPA
jgi:hypothetical protein